MLTVCSKCRKPLYDIDHFLEITTEDGTVYCFCTLCINEGYDALSEKPDRDKGETDLMIGFRNFLTKHRMVAQA